ncbi:MAG: LytTR family DNA-binding domain-containing protein [Rubricoccaceae bacterium]
MPDASSSPPLRVLIVDDEAPARQRLKRLLKSYEDDGTLGPIDEASDGVDALDVMNAAEAYDIVFLDVRMPELDGFDVLDRLPPRHRPAVVFTTAYDEYALRAFEANAIDYLLKPIDSDRLAESVERAEELAARRSSPGATDDRIDRLAALLDGLDADAISDPPQAKGDLLRQFSVQGKDRLFVISVDDIVTVEVHDSITNLFALAPDGTVDRHIVSFTLDAIESRLSDETFMRVHRGAIANLTHIRELIPWFSGRYKLVFSGGHDVIASRSRGRDLRERLSL